MITSRPLTGPTKRFIVAIVALATLFMLQGSRVFVGYLVFVVDQSERVTLALAALVVFSAPALAWILVRMSRATNVLAGSISMLIVARLVMQFWEHPTARVLLGAAVIITWGWATIVAIFKAREATAIGLIFGLTADVVVRMANGAIDLPWMPGLGSHVATVALGFALLLVTQRWIRDADTNVAGSSAATLPIIAIGPVLALHHLVTGNLALAHLGAGGE
ncbi:MAG TPA: hypothetical protein VHG52_12345, partial [Thermomicrobiales bacterium]|nr:hypothetical protein [Thermomicrobiales bacterium]